MPKVNAGKAPKAGKPAAPAMGGDGPQAPATRRGEARREALLQAAAEVFREKGYAATSIEDVVERTGGSKATLYAYFGNKEGLFGAMIAAGCDEFLANLAIPRQVEGDIEQTLLALGRRVLKLFMDPKRLLMLRGLMSESGRYPHLAERLYANGPARGRAMLSAFLRGQHEAGVIHCPEPELSAVQFMEMVKAHAQWRAMLGLEAFPPDLDAERVVRAAVNTFLKAHDKSWGEKAR